MGDKGKMGVIVKIIEERNWCIVEGLNTEYEYDENRPPRKKTKPLLMTTQVKLVDLVDERGCDVEWRYTEEGDRVRVSTRSHRILPIPKSAFITNDFPTWRPTARGRRTRTRPKSLSSPTSRNS